jgi:hypothetical protein
MNPQFPIYIPSKGRADSRLTMRFFDAVGVPYSVIVEEQEYNNYATVISKDKLLVLDKAYQRDYTALINLDDSQSKGSGPARNFAWDNAVTAGAKWHWIVDDNIYRFDRLNRNLFVPVADGTIFKCMEDFVLRYKNVAIAGPNYQHFVPYREKKLPFNANTRIYSCILVRNDLPFRWRGRYNEDTILSLDVMKAGWCTIQFNAFVQKKVQTQTMRGGNTDAFYAAEGTLPKARMLAKLHPDVARVTWRYGRWHHYVDYSPFRRNKLVRRSDVEIPSGIDNYGMQLVKLGQAA